jgi:hypothetical protein
MSHATEHPVRCAHPECGASHPSSRWAEIRAHDEGWFTKKDGTAYCPKHVPEWVTKWRAKQAGPVNEIAVNIIISIVTILISVSASMFISGTRWGRVETMMADLTNDRVRQADINGVRDRLSRIEGMFTLSLKDGAK